MSSDKVTRKGSLKGGHLARVNKKRKKRKKIEKGVDKGGEGWYIKQAVRHGGRAAEDNEKKSKKGLDKAYGICYDSQAVRESGRAGPKETWKKLKKGLDKSLEVW